jgi:FdhD protein
MNDTNSDVCTEWFDVTQFTGRTMQRKRAAVIRELSLDVFVDGSRIASIACTGKHVDELAVGFISSEGMIRGKDDIAAVDISGDGGAVYITLADRDVPAERKEAPAIASSGARSFRTKRRLAPLTRGQDRAFTIEPTLPCALMQEMIARASLHERTRGTHCAALADGSGIVAVREDIGRHNAIDMLAGHILMNPMDAAEKMIIRTGRVSAEIIHKIWNIGIPMVISISVPTSAAVHLAREAGITVIGSVREDTMVIYHDEERVRI